MAPWCHEPNIHDRIAYIGLHLFGIFNIIIAIMAIRATCQPQNKTKKIFKYMYIMINILFVIPPYAFTIFIQCTWECWFDFFYFSLMAQIATCAYRYGSAFLCLFFLLRLKFVFDRIPTLRLNKYIYYVLLFGMVIQFTTPPLCTYYFLSGWDKNSVWALRFVAAFNYTNVIESVIIFIIFIKKIMSQSVKEYEHENTSKTDNVTEKTMFDEEMLAFSIRVIICYLFAIISSNGNCLIYMLRASITKWALSFDVVVYHCLYIGFDTTTNMICLYLQMSFGKNLYEKCCMNIHGCCENIVTRTVKQQQTDVDI